VAQQAFRPAGPRLALRRLARQTFYFLACCDDVAHDRQTRGDPVIRRVFQTAGSRFRRCRFVDTSKPEACGHRRTRERNPKARAYDSSQGVDMGKVEGHGLAPVAGHNGRMRRQIDASDPAGRKLAARMNASVYVLNAGHTP
jgi:hypothetical protein